MPELQKLALTALLGVLASVCNCLVRQELIRYIESMKLLRPHDVRRGTASHRDVNWRSMPDQPNNRWKAPFYEGSAAPSHLMLRPLTRHVIHGTGAG